jgi:hypothetical protein
VARGSSPVVAFAPARRKKRVDRILGIFGSHDAIVETGQPLTCPFNFIRQKIRIELILFKS